MVDSTRPRIRDATALLVGLEHELGETCGDVLGLLGFKVLKVGHAAAACERIPVAMPMLVVVPQDAKPEDRAEVKERCIAVGAELVVTPSLPNQEDVVAIVREAAVAVLDGTRRG